MEKKIVVDGKEIFFCHANVVIKYRLLKKRDFQCKRFEIDFLKFRIALPNPALGNYTNKKFSTLNTRIKPKSMNIFGNLLFNSGTVISAGNRSFLQAIVNIHLYVNYLSKLLDIELTFCDVTLKNLVINFKCGFRIDLELLSSSYGKGKAKFCTYASEKEEITDFEHLLKNKEIKSDIPHHNFPAVIIWPFQYEENENKKEKISFLLFATGNINITGRSKKYNDETLVLMAYQIAKKYQFKTSNTQLEKYSK